MDNYIYGYPGELVADPVSAPRREQLAGGESLDLNEIKEGKKYGNVSVACSACKLQMSMGYRYNRYNEEHIREFWEAKVRKHGFWQVPGCETQWLCAECVAEETDKTTILGCKPENIVVRDDCCEKEGECEKEGSSL